MSVFMQGLGAGQESKIFASEGQLVKGVTKKGKEFFRALMPGCVICRNQISGNQTLRRSSSRKMRTFSWQYIGYPSQCHPQN